MSNTPFPPDRDLTAVSMAFRNRRFIAEKALPRFPVHDFLYSYAVHNFETGFVLTDDVVGRRSATNEIGYSSKDKEGRALDRALKEVVPSYDSRSARGGKQQDEGYLHARASERVTNRILLNREKRVADLLFNPEIYPDENKITLAGSASFSDFENSDPIRIMTDGLETPVMRPNTGVIGRPLWSVLSRHPKVVKAAHGNSGDSGIATVERVKEMLELDTLLIGEGYYIAREKAESAGEQEPLRLWGSSMCFYYLDDLGGPDENPSFGFTAEYGERFGAKTFDKDQGMKGSWEVRVGETLDEQVCAPRLGYLIEDPATQAA